MKHNTYTTCNRCMPWFQFTDNKMPKKPPSPLTPAKEASKSLGLSPAALMKYQENRNTSWCPKNEIEYDINCDPAHPRTISYKDISRALPDIRERFEKTPLIKSKSSKKLGIELYFKLETVYTTGSFKERAAYYALTSLTQQQQDNGVVTASLGNFGVALAYCARKLNIKASIVYPQDTPTYFIEKCKKYGGRVMVNGENFKEAKHEAFVLAVDLGFIYINGYDHPSVIAASGTIGLEIMEDLPDVDVIMVPVGGGSLIAGVAAAAKHIKPLVKIYGVEPEKCCCFFKAMDNDGIFETEVSQSLANRSLGIPIAGVNSFHTAKPLVSKMILVDDDWITRAILNFVEEEKLVVDGPGATSFSALLAMPDVLPELQGQKVVCIVTGSNIDIVTLPRCMERAKAVEGRLVKLKVKVLADCPTDQAHVMSMIANTGCNVLRCTVDHTWIYENDLEKQNFKLVIETTGLEQACQLKRVMTKLFPNRCEFLEEPFSPIPICTCFPKKKIFGSKDHDHHQNRHPSKSS